MKKSPNPIKEKIANCITGALVLLFLYVAIIKLLTFNAFVVQLEQSPLLNKWAALTVAIAIPLVQFGITALLAFTRTRALGLFAAATLFAVFAMYTYYVPHRFTDAGCSCTGIISMLNWEGHFYLNLGLLTSTAIALVLYPSDVVNFQKRSSILN